MMAICDDIITIFDGKITGRIGRKRTYERGGTATCNPEEIIKKIQMSKYMVYIVLAVVFVFFAITLRDNGFASTQNLFKHF